MVLALLLPVLIAVRGNEASGGLIVLFLVAGANLAWATEDPAADLLDSMPVSKRRRLLLRLVVVTSISGAGLAIGIGVVAWRQGWPADLQDNLLLLAVAASAGVAVGLFGRRHGEASSGPFGVASGALLPVLSSAFAYRWPATFPSIAVSPVHARWWFAVAAAAAVSLWMSRDPSPR